MGGKRMRLEKVVSPEETQPPGESRKETETEEKTSGAKVISLKDLKKK
jgi:hypothetical protein